MDSKILHNMKDIPFNERESFNNAILLLSMVKSEYYYIVGFSRPNNIIEIGFDLEVNTYGQISETFVMDFSSNSTRILITSQLTNIVFNEKNKIPFRQKGNFKINNGNIVYEKLFPKDDVIPVSMDKLNLIIMSVKKEFEEFIRQGFAYIISQRRK